MSRLFTFADGRTLLDKVRDGTIHDLASLEAELAALGGATVIGPEDAPVFHLTLTKNLAGDAGFDVAFDQFGGHVELSGGVHASADVSLDLTFGYNATDGFYIQTDGLSPEVSITNIVVTGELDGVGQLGFLGVALDEATLTFNSVTVGFNVGSPTGDGKIHFSDLFDPDALVAATSISVAGTADLHAGARVLAFTGDDEEPFELASATLGVHWADLTQPTNVVVTLTGGLADFLKVRVDEILSKLTALRDGMAALGIGNVPYISSGLSSVISVLQVLDDNTVSAGGVDGAASFLTAQDFAGRLAQQLGIDPDALGFGLSGSTLSWSFALDGTILSADGLGFSDVSGSLDNLHVTIGIDFSKLIDLGGGVSFSIANALSVVVTGDVSNVNLFDILTGGATFEVGHQTLTAQIDGSGVDTTLTTFGLDLTGPTRFLRIGTDDAHVMISDGTLAVGLLSPSDGADTRRWATVRALGLGGDVNFGGIVTASAHGVNVAFNDASGSGATPLNWGTAFPAPVTVLGLSLNLSGALKSVAGSLTGVDVAGVLTGSAGFAVTKESVTVNDGVAPPIDAVLVAVQLTSPDLRIGTADVYAG